MGLIKGFKKGVINYTKIKLREKLNYDQLYEVIKDGDYPSGKPEITGKGIMRAIRFEATGKYQIMVALSGRTISISNIHSGVSGMAKEMVADAFTDDLYGVFNNEKQDGNANVQEIGKEVRRLLEEANLLA
ncbi:MAG: hypothetical protein GX787_04675 [Tissierellia bacterium]|jgi:hypothetical protein|nr:hypothetical protein [Tissierellia bacterium]